MAIPCSDKLRGLPQHPFIGQLGYGQVGRLLRDNRRWLSKPERTIVDDVVHYLSFKVLNVRRDRHEEKQINLPLE